MYYFNFYLALIFFIIFIVSILENDPQVENNKHLPNRLVSIVEEQQHVLQPNIDEVWAQDRRSLRSDGSNVEQRKPVQEPVVAESVREVVVNVPFVAESVREVEDNVPFVVEPESGSDERDTRGLGRGSAGKKRVAEDRVLR